MKIEDPFVGGQIKGTVTTPACQDIINKQLPLMNPPYL
jgi:hypothetical protein